MRKLQSIIFVTLLIIGFVLFASPKTRVFSYVIFIPLAIALAVTAITYLVVKFSRRNN